MNYRKLLFVAGASLFSLQMFGAPLTPEESLARVMAEKDLRQGVPSLYSNSLSLVDSWIMPESGEPALYVFQSMGTTPGFIILSADDNAESLLARVEGVYDFDDIPAPCKYWLDQFSRHVEFAASNPLLEEVDCSSPKKLTPFLERKNIDPLVKVKWSQDYPYNMYTPEYNNGHYVTGCVATAMAQVMSVHKWPLKGKGSHSYTYKDNTYSIDFSELTFDWDIMPEKWSSDQADKIEGYEEIAKLMKAVGYSVNMMWGPESGAPAQNCSPSLFEYFGYSKSSLLDKDSYCEREWTDMMYNELAAGRPIIYNGSDSDRGSAHCFVCDGYSIDGTFHFNWGWGGRYDGYFRLSALKPSGVGTGGGSGNYSSGQTAVVGLAKYGTPDLPRVWPLYITGGVSSDLRNPITDGTTVPIQFKEGYVLNNSNYEFDGNLGIEVVQDGESKMIWNGWEVGFDGLTPTLSMCGFSNYEVTAKTSSLDPGIYQLFPVFKMEKTNWWYRIPVEQGTSQCITLTVTSKKKGMLSSSGVSFMPDIEIYNMEVVGEPNSEEECEFCLYYRGGTRDFTGNIYLKAQIDGGDVVVGGVEVSTKAEVVAKMNVTIPLDIRKGEYTVYFSDAYGNHISDMMMLTVNEPSGVEMIFSQDNEMEYFDLLGRRVKNQVKGITIRRDSKGNVVKQVL